MPLKRSVITYSKLAGFWRVWVLLMAAGTGSLRAGWQEELSGPAPGGFPALRPVTLEYVCGWAGLKAGAVEARFTRPEDDVCKLEVKAGTTGLARALWKLDATHEARGIVSTLKPLAVRQFLFWLEARSPQAARG